MVAMSGFYITWLGSLRILALAFGYSSLAHETSIGTFYLSLFSPFRVLPTNYVNPNSPTPKIQDGFLSLVKGTTKFYLLLLFMYLSYYIGDGFIQRSIIYGAVVYYGARFEKKWEKEGEKGRERKREKKKEKERGRSKNEKRQKKKKKKKKRKTKKGKAKTKPKGKEKKRKITRI